MKAGRPAAAAPSSPCRPVLAGEARSSLFMRTNRQAGVTVEHRRPGQEVLLTFVASPEVLEHFRADLRNQGLAVQEEPFVPGFLSTCRLQPGPRH